MFFPCWLFAPPLHSLIVAGLLFVPHTVGLSCWTECHLEWINKESNISEEL